MSQQPWLWGDNAWVTPSVGAHHWQREDRQSKQLSGPRMHLLCGRLHGKDWLNRMEAEEGEMGVAACGGSLQEAAQPEQWPWVWGSFGSHLLCFPLPTQICSAVSFPKQQGLCWVLPCPTAFTGLPEQCSIAMRQWAVPAWCTLASGCLNFFIINSLFRLYLYVHTHWLWDSHFL